MAPILLLRRNRLQYPGGSPGINPAHPASAGLQLSAAFFGGFFTSPGNNGTAPINLVTAKGPNTLANCTLVMDGALGPACFINGSGAGAHQFTGTGGASTKFTAAGFFRQTGSQAGYQTIIAWNGANNGLYINAGNVDFYTIGSNDHTGPAVAANVPYFVAASITSGGSCNIVLTNLLTGAITSAVVSAGTVNSVSFGTITIGSDAANDFFIGNGGNAMVAQSYLSMPQLLQWAQDPWAFWYPPEVDLAEIIRTPPAITPSGGQDAWQQRSIVLRQTPNKLQYPGRNTIPGIDRTHPAAKNCRFSAIPATGTANDVNILTGAALINNNPSRTAVPIPAVDGLIGPCLTDPFNSIVTGIAVPSATRIQHTVGAIFRFSSDLGGLYQGLVVFDNQYGLYIRVGQPVFYTNADNTASITLTLGHAYFIAASVSFTNPSSITYVVRDLNTGKVQSSTVTQTFTGVATSTINIGTDTGNAYSNFPIAAGMYSETTLTLQQLLQWADSPWSFWYPQKVDLAQSIRTPPPPAGGIAWVQGAGANSGAANVSSLAATLAAPVGVGNTICGYVSCGTTGGVTINSVSDDKGNTYNLETILTDSTNAERGAIFSRSNITNGPTVFTATFSGSVGGDSIIVDEFSGCGVATTDQRDGSAHGGQVQTAAASGTGANGVNSTTFTTTTNGDLLYGATANTGAGDDTGTLTAGTTTNATFTLTGTSSLTSANHCPMLKSEWAVQSTASASTGAFFTQSVAVARITSFVAIKPAPPAALVAPLLFAPPPRSQLRRAFVAPVVPTAIVSGAAAGIGAATAVGTGINTAIGSAPNTPGTVNGIGAALFTAQGAAVGTGAATATGRSTAVAQGAALGTGVANGIAPSAALFDSGTFDYVTFDAALSAAAVAGLASGIAAGTGAANATGFSLVSAQGAATGAGAANAQTAAQGAASGTGAAAAQAAGQGAAAATGTVNGAGASKVAAQGAATGTGSATAITGTAGLAAGTSTATAIGASLASAQGAAAGTSTAAANVVTIAIGAAAGIGAASGVGRATALAQGASAGTGAASAVGTGITTAQGAAAGTSTAAAIGAALFTAQGASAGTSTATATGQSSAVAQGAASGTGAANGVGSFAVQGAATGTGAASGIGASLFTAQGASAGTGSATAITGTAGLAAGTGAATAVGRSTAAAQGAATGTSTAAAQVASQGNAIGTGATAAQAAAQGAAAGIGAANGAGTSKVVAQGAALGTSTASAFGVGTYLGAASGAGAATAVGTGINLAVGSAAGTSTASAPGTGLKIANGNSTGLGAASAVGTGINLAVGNATGTSTANAIGTGLTFATGNATGTSTALAAGTGIKFGVGNATGTSTAAASGIGFKFANGSAAGLGSASAVGRATNAAIGNASGVGFANAVGSGIRFAVGNASGIGQAIGSIATAWPTEIIAQFKPIPEFIGTMPTPASQFTDFIGHIP